MKRIRLAIAAAVVAAVLIHANGWNPLCLLVEKGSALWVIWGCDDGQPDPPPCSNCG